MDQSVTTRTKGLFYGWWIVIACSVMTLYGSGVFYYGFTAFFEPMVNEFGWSRAATSLAFSLQRLQGGVAAPIIGFLVDRFGSQKLMLFGMIILGGSLALMSRIDSLMFFYATFMLGSIGSSAGTGSVGMAAVANWFVKKRGKALGIMMAGVGFSGILAPVLVFLINNYGWRTALVLAGVGTWIVGIPLAMVVRHRPEQYGMLPDGDLPAQTELDDEDKKRISLAIRQAAADDSQEFTTKEALRTWAFWALSLALSLSQLATGALFIHEIPFLNSIGIPPETGALVVMFMTLSSIFGRLGFGWLGDFMDKRHVIAITFALQFFGMLIAAFATELWQIAIFVLLFGPGYGGAIPVRPALQADYFGRKAFGAIQGLIMGVTTFGGVIGPVFAGWMFDVSGEYRTAFLLLAIAFFPALPALLAAKKPVKKMAAISIQRSA